MGSTFGGISLVMEAISLTQVGSLHREPIDVEEPLQRARVEEVVQGKMTFFEKEVLKTLDGQMLTLLNIWPSPKVFNNHLTLMLSSSDGYIVNQPCRVGRNRAVT